MGPSDGTVDSHGQSHLSHGTVGYGGAQVGQWTPMDSPTCPMVQGGRTDSGICGSSGGTVHSHGQSHLSHGTVG